MDSKGFGATEAVLVWSGVAHSDRRSDMPSIPQSNTQARTVRPANPTERLLHPGRYVQRRRHLMLLHPAARLESTLRGACGSMARFPEWRAFLFPDARSRWSMECPSLLHAPLRTDPAGTARWRYLPACSRSWTAQWMPAGQGGFVCMVLGVYGGAGTWTGWAFPPPARRFGIQLNRLLGFASIIRWWELLLTGYVDLE